MKKLNGRTRCSQYGTLIQCPHCGDSKPVYHLAWSALWCSKCLHVVEKNEWFFVRHQTLAELAQASGWDLWEL